VAKVRAGACLIQLYSALVFRGLGLINDIKLTLADAISPRQRIDDLVGVDAAAMTAQPWPQ
jgi:dihydroorotate dehydrogenase